MKSILVPVFISILFFGISSLARLHERFTSPEPANLILQNSTLSVAPGKRPVPPRPPIDLDYDENIALRITAYTSPHPSTDSLLPCVTDMMSEAFNAVWGKEDQHPKLQNYRYDCSRETLQFSVESEQVSVPMEYPDLITIANMLVQFQQSYVMPGLKFEYYLKGNVIGTGFVRALVNSNGTQTLSEE